MKLIIYMPERFVRIAEEIIPRIFNYAGYLRKAQANGFVYSLERVLTEYELEILVEAVDLAKISSKVLYAGNWDDIIDIPTWRYFVDEQADFKIECRRDLDYSNS